MAANIVITQIDNTITANQTTDQINVTTTNTNVIISSVTLSDINLSNIGTPIVSNSNITTSANISADYVLANDVIASNITGNLTGSVNFTGNLDTDYSLNVGNASANNQVVMGEPNGYHSITGTKLSVNTTQGIQTIGGLQSFNGITLSNGVPNVSYSSATIGYGGGTQISIQDFKTANITIDNSNANIIMGRSGGQAEGEVKLSSKNFWFGQNAFDEDSAIQFKNVQGNAATGFASNILLNNAGRNEDIFGNANSAYAHILNGSGVGAKIIKLGGFDSLHFGGNGNSVINANSNMIVSGNLTVNGAVSGTGFYDSSDFNTDFASKTTDNLTEGSTNLYFSGKTTDDLTEGSANLWYTTDRANLAIVDYLQDNNVIMGANANVTGNLNVTGYINGNFSISNTTSDTFQINAGVGYLRDGAFESYRPGQPNAVLEWDEAADRWRHGINGNEYFIPIDTDDLSEASNLWYTNARVNAFLTTTGVTGDVTIQGNLQVNGNIDYVNVEDLLVTDNSITLNYGNAAARDAFIYVDRSGSTLNNAYIKWNETDDDWEIYDGTTTYNIPKSTSDLTEGTNLYWTTDRGNTNSDAWLTTKTTDDLTEGSTNLYYSNALVEAYLSDTTPTINANTIQANSFIGGTFTGDGSDLEDVRAESVEVTLKNVSGSTIGKGYPVHATGYSGSGEVECILADAGNAETMPAHFIAQDTMANAATGRGILAGRIQNVDTSSFSIGDTIYVAVGGGYANTAPTGEANVIQNLGVVTRLDANVGGGEVMGAGRSAATPNLDEGNIFVGSSSNTAITVTPHTNFVTTGNAFSLSNSLTDVNKVTSESATAMTLYAQNGVELNQTVDSSESKIIDISTEGYRVVNADAGNANIASVTGAAKNMLILGSVTSGSNTIAVLPLQFIGYPAGIYVAGQTSASQFFDTSIGTSYTPIQDGFANASVFGGVQNNAGWKIYDTGAGSFTSLFPGNAYVTSIQGSPASGTQTITMSEPAIASSTTGLVMFHGAASPNYDVSMILKTTAESSGYTTADYDGLRPFGMYFTNPETLANTTMLATIGDTTFDLANIEMQHVADLTAGKQSAVRIDQLLLIGANANPDFQSATANTTVPSEASSLGVTLESDGLTTWKDANATPVTKFLINQYTDNTLKAGNVLPTWAEPFASDSHDNNMTYITPATFNFKLLDSNKSSSTFAVSNDEIVGRISWNYVSAGAPIYNMGVDQLTPPASIVAKTPSSQATTDKTASLDVFLQSTYSTSYRDGSANTAGSIPRTFLASKDGNTIIAAKTDGKIQLKPVRDYGDDGTTGNASFDLNRFSHETHDYHTFLSAEFSNTSAKTGTLVTIQDASGETNNDSNGFNYNSKGDATLRLKTHFSNSDVHYYWDINHNESSEKLEIKYPTGTAFTADETQVTFTSIPTLPQYSNVSLPTSVTGGMIYVTNGNNKPAYGDGTNWYYYDGTQVT